MLESIDRLTWRRAAILGIAGVIIVAVLSVGAFYFVLFTGGSDAVWISVEDASEYDVSNDDVVEYSSLTEAQQQLFLTALRSDEPHTDIHDGTNISIWYSHNYVSYENNTYRVQIAE